jgi:signal transduction histidine kinase
MSFAASRGLGVADFLMFYFGSAGFQMFATMSTALMLREAEARADLAHANAELHATRRLLADSSRASERLRIARDLHDTIGHHLAALSLQLDVASRLAPDDAGHHVSRAHAITRLLLAEVRSVVSEMREGSKTNLVEVIRSIASAPHAPPVHLDMPERLIVEDEAQALSLVRCVQEIITNATRHANARNLWIRIDVNASGVVLHARDHGRGAHAVTPGNG